MLHSCPSDPVGWAVGPVFDGVAVESRAVAVVIAVPPRRVRDRQVREADSGQRRRIAEPRRHCRRGARPRRNSRTSVSTYYSLYEGCLKSFEPHTENEEIGR